MYYTKINIEKKQADCSVYLIWWKARYVYVIFLSFFFKFSFLGETS